MNIYIMIFMRSSLLSSPFYCMNGFQYWRLRRQIFQRRETVEWSDQLVREVTSVSNPISRAVYFWVDSMLQGYITEFVVDTITS